MGRPKGSGNKTDDLKAFAIRIEKHVLKAKLKDQESMERLICRLLTGGEKSPAIAAMLAQKWVEWRYGKAKETVEHIGEGGGPISHTIRFGNGNSDT